MGDCRNLSICSNVQISPSKFLIWNEFCDDLEEPLLSLIRNLRNIGVGLQTYAYICVGLQEAQISQCSASYEAQCTSPLNSTPLQTPQNILRSYPGHKNFRQNITWIFYSDPVKP